MVDVWGVTIKLRFERQIPIAGFLAVLPPSQLEIVDIFLSSKTQITQKNKNNRIIYLTVLFPAYTASTLCAGFENVFDFVRT